MKIQMIMASLTETLPESVQPGSEDKANEASLAFSSEVGLILLGVALLASGGYVFLVKLCKSFASRGSE